MSDQSMRERLADYGVSGDERDADPSKHTFTRRFDLRGKGDTVEVDICSMDERTDSGRVVMYYATAPTETHGNAIDRSYFRHDLTLRVTADNLPMPVDRTFRISVDNDQLKMEPLNETPENT